MRNKVAVQKKNENEVFIDNKPVTIFKSNTTLKQLKENMRILNRKKY